MSRQEGKNMTRDRRINFWFRGHHYTSQIAHNLRHMLWIDNYKGWAWRYTHLTWLSHGSDCCDYWTPVHLKDGSINPKVQRAFMLDDELHLPKGGE